MLGHSSIVTTAGTYASVLPGAAHRGDMIIKATSALPGSRRGETAMTHVPAAVTASGCCQM